VRSEDSSPVCKFRSLLLLALLLLLMLLLPLNFGRGEGNSLTAHDGYAKVVQKRPTATHSNAQYELKSLRWAYGFPG